jgi:small subunit ribosomal protein S3
MGQKVHPYGFRLGIIRDTKSKWFAEGNTYRDQLVEDLQARSMILKRHHHAGISDILIERAAGTTTITIESAKPGIIIGRGGADVDRLRRDLDRTMSGRVRLNVEETKDPETNAQLIAEEIAGQIERRASIRRAVSQAVERAVRAGVAGIRVAVSGRLMGAEIARTERVGPVGSVPLHTLRADVDRGFSEAATGYGHIGVQVLVSRGIVLPPPKQRPTSSAEAEAETEVAVISGAVAETPAIETQGEAPVAEIDALLAETPMDEPVAPASEATPPPADEGRPEPSMAEPMADTEDTTDAVEEATGDVDA